jgi:hypothetical protein
MSAIKYDPMVNMHVLFNEVKMASGKKRTWPISDVELYTL